MITEHQQKSSCTQEASCMQLVNASRMHKQLHPAHLPCYIPNPPVVVGEWVVNTAECPTSFELSTYISGLTASAPYAKVEIRGHTSRLRPYLLSIYMATVGVSDSTLAVQIDVNMWSPENLNGTDVFDRYVYAVNYVYYMRGILIFSV